jgi:hypothetical protein
LSYWVRRDDLLLVFVNTLWSGLGGEGHVETEWLRKVLQQNRDARHKLVAGHHPVYPVNGYSGPYQRHVGPEHAGAFWNALVANGVLAYFCSHILAFDVQVHRGVLQICSAGAGTAHLMPEGIEYLHCVQAALDAQGLRYQVLDTRGRVRERLSWPLPPAPGPWRSLRVGENVALVGREFAGGFIHFRFSGRAAAQGASRAQTLLSAFRLPLTASLWMGLKGPQQRVAVIIAGEPRRSPHFWLGPAVTADKPFELQILIHTGMGPGGIMCRFSDEGRWSSLTAASPWGAERLDWPDRWSIGHAEHGVHDRPFLGTALEAAAKIG